MKSSILVCQLSTGALHSAAFPTFAEANEAAAKVRKSRTVEAGKKVVPVVTAVIITQNAGSAQVVKTINVQAEARREAVEAEAAAKAKAEKKAKAEAEAKANENK